MTPRDLAIQYALGNRWQKAFNINKKILKDAPYDIDTLNRIAFCLIKLGRYRRAKEFYKKSIKLDKTNPIAVKNLKKLETITKKMQKEQSSSFGTGDNGAQGYAGLEDLFIEEAGKTKTIELRNIADRRTLSLLQPGNNVSLVVKRSKIFVVTGDKKYIGMLPDNIGVRLVRFIRGGNIYHANIKAIDEKSVTVFIKEEKRAARFKNQPSFSIPGFSYQFLREDEG